jgi:ABC-type uncharacterized transport system ATPase subunit
VGNGYLLYYYPQSGFTPFTPPPGLQGAQLRQLVGILPHPLTLIIVLVLGCWFRLPRTRFGQQTYAIGGNSEASLRAGLNGRAVTFASSENARAAGIETIYQDLGVLRAVDRRRMLEESRHILSQLDIRIPGLARPIRQMSGGQRQAVAIARAVYWNARLMIMDEPTVALAVAEQRKVLARVRTLRERGVGVIIISHNLQDVMDVADRIVIMRRGRTVGERFEAA